MGCSSRGETVYYPFTRFGVSIKIFAPPKEDSPSRSSPEIFLKERDGVAYWTLSLEAYAVIQANRREGIRELDVLRFRRIRDKVDWEKVLRLGERMDKRKAREFVRLVSS